MMLQGFMLYQSLNSCALPMMRPGLEVLLLTNAQEGCA